MSSDADRLLRILLKVSEKAANIARICRQNSSLFELLVQEKSGDEKNCRFFHDFKTLADVLIQETIRHDIGTEFPDLAKMVRGEESNAFSNVLGETVIVEVCSSREETAKWLEKVLDNDAETAMVLATEVHGEIRLSDVPVDRQLPSDLRIPLEDLGIWIDPIDCTADYINGHEAVDEATGIHSSGLRCVTVLIGAYLKSTGEPVLGVINQPFYERRDSQWTGKCCWGLLDGGTGKSSLKEPAAKKKTVVLSRCEDSKIISNLADGGFSPIEVAGAGYKCLTVAVGQADAYVCSKGTTHRWDTCASQAILRSLGGGIIDYGKFRQGLVSELKYFFDEVNFCNVGGLIAYRDEQVLESLKRALFR